MQAMAPVLDNTQLQALQTTLRTVLAGFRIEECSPASPTDALSYYFLTKSPNKIQNVV